MSESKLEVSANRFADPDQAYAMLAHAHRGLSEEQSAAFNARLILIMANQIGDIEVLRQAIALAKQGGRD